MSDTRILLTGRDGQVGWELERSLAPLGRVVALARRDLDLADPAAIRERVRGVRPDVIVNAAAYTAVDRAESEPDLAEAVNARAPAILAEEARRLGAPLVHYSTDYVFDGASAVPYREDDATAPASVYGRTKRAGEEAVAAAGGPHCVLRTSWVYGTRGRNFFLTVCRLHRSGKPLRIVSDQLGAPTWSRWLADATATILVAGGILRGRLRDSFSEHAGVYHLAAAGETSWHGFAQAIVDGLATFGSGSEEGAQRSEVTPIATSEYPTAAVRPARSVLATGKVAATWGVRVAPWREQLGLCLAEYREREALVSPRSASGSG